MAMATAMHNAEAEAASSWSVGSDPLPAAADRDHANEKSPIRDVFRVNVIDLDKNGNAIRAWKSVADILRLREETRLPIRDLRLFFQNSHRSVAGYTDSNPAVIITRPSSNSFLLSLEHMKLLCRKDVVTILNPDDASVQSFVSALRDQLKSKPEHRASPAPGLRHEESSVHIFLAALADKNEPNFELIVLEHALAAVTNKFRRRLNLLKPMLDVLLHETSTNPNASMLRRMLALRKSLNSFMTSVKAVLTAVNGVLKADHNFFGGRRLSVSDTEFEAEEVELLLGAYSSELKEIEHDLQNVDEQIEDTNDFINIHLNSIRNRIIKLSLFIEAGTLCVGLCTLVAGFFGMNLNSGLEESKTAFILTCVLTLVFGGSLFGIFVNRYSQIQEDASSAKDYQNIKHFFTYVESVENAVGDLHTVTGTEFGKVLESVVSPSITVKESESISRLLDVCKKVPAENTTPYSTVTATNNFQLLRIANASNKLRPSVIVHESDNAPTAHKRLSHA